jgi:uncharacterized protein (TIRG00374 family)
MISGSYRKQLWFGILVSLGLLYLLFRKIDWNLLFKAFSEIDAKFVAAAVAATFLGYYIRAIRWRYLVEPMKRVPMRSLFSCTIIGYMANNILPARLGEVVRAYALGDRENLDTSSVFATLVLDRLLDGFTVLLLLVATLFTLIFPAGMERARKSIVAGGYVTLALYVAVLFFLFLLKTRKEMTLSFLQKFLKPFPDRFSRWVSSLVDSFIRGVQVSWNRRQIAGLIWTSLAMWGLAVWTVDLVLQGFGITLPITAAMFILILLVFAVMVPASPGFIGTYHAACMYGLMVFNLPKEKALSIALTVHGISFFPVTLLGLYFFLKNRKPLSGIKNLTLQQVDPVAHK